MARFCYRSLMVLGVVFLLSMEKHPDKDSVTWYVFKGGKIPPVPYVERLVTSPGAIYVSSIKPDESKIWSYSLDLKDGQALYLVELKDPKGPKLYGEVYRMEQFAIVKLWEVPSNSHVHMGNAYNFVKKVVTKREALRLPSSLTQPVVVKKSLPQPLRPVGEIVIEEGRLHQWLEEFSGEREVVLGNAPATKILERGSVNGRKQARAWLGQEYGKLGYLTSEHNYGTGINFVAERSGSDPASKTLIVSAHLDSVGNAGADDDGSGTISVLAIADALNALPLKHNLRVVGFDQEERGLIGSEHYAEHINSSGESDQILGVLNVEMTGYDNDRDGAYHAIHCNENTSKNLADLVVRLSDSSHLNLKSIAACTNRSDHASFWEYGIPAIVVSQNFFGPQMDANPCYHRSCDKVNILNFGYMRDLTQVLAETVAQLVL